MSESPASEPLLWTVNRTALELGVSRAHIYRLIRENKIPYVRLSDAILRFDPAEIREWLTARKRPAVR